MSTKAFSWRALAASCCALALGCGSNAPATSAATSVGPAGGTVSMANGPSVEIPPNALASSTNITIEKTTASAPSGAVTAVYKFGPDGTIFAQPVLVRFPVPAGTSSGSTYWTRLNSPTDYDSLVTTFSGTTAATQVTHFSQGFVGAPCTTGTGCAPAAACHAGASSCHTGAPVCTEVGSVNDGTSCGGSNICTAGTCGPVIPCPADSPAGTACSTAGLVCRAGICVSARTVSGTLSTVYRKDGGITVVAGVPVEDPFALTAILVPDNTVAGYTTIPVKVDPVSFHFNVPNVPQGQYFLQIDRTSFINQPDPTVPGSAQTPVIVRTLFEANSSTPDLSSLIAGRSDRAISTTATNVTVNLTNMTPWASGDAIILASSQASVSNDRVNQILRPRPVAGNTSLTGSFDWNSIFGASATFLPDASKGDLTYVYHRSTTALPPVSPQPTLYRNAREYALLNDFTVTNGTPANMTAAFTAAPQTGSFRANFLLSQFAALAPQVHNSAKPSDLILNPGSAGATVFAQPYSTTFPNQPTGGDTPLAFLSLGDDLNDHDYGTLNYGQFLAANWAGEFMQVFYSYDFTLTNSVAMTEGYLAQVPAAQFGNAIAPLIGPPTAPKINGTDAFTTQTKVGSTPVFSWSAPALGTATQYQVNVVVRNATLQPNEVDSVGAVVFSGTSFKLPGGFMQAGRSYAGRIQALNSPQRLDDPIQRSSTFSSVGTNFGLFSR